MERLAAVIASKYINRMLSLPPDGELLNMCALPAPTGCNGGKYSDPWEYVTADFDPVVHKDRLHLGHHGTSDTIVRIAPMFRVLRMARPLICDSNPARKTGMSVDNQQLAVCAIV